MAQTKSNVSTHAPHAGSSDEIKNDIRHTRVEMDETLDELGQRLTPRRLLDDFLELFSPRDSDGSSTVDQVSTTLKRGGKTVSRYARENPVPTLLMAAGVAWAIYDAASEDEDEETGYRRRAKRTAYGSSAGSPYVTASVSSLDEEYSDFSSNDGAGGPSTAERAKGAIHSTGEAVSGAAASAGEAASAAWRGTKRAGRSTYRTAGSMTSAARHYADEGMHQSRDALRFAGHRFDEASKAYPLAVAGGFIAVGLLAGLVLPRTRTEDEWLGETADEAWDQAKAAGEELMQQGKAAAAATAEAAMEEAEAQGLTPDELSKKAGRVADKVTKAASDATRQEGLDTQSMKEKGKEVGAQAKAAAQDATRS
jgi:hypothetical protein